MLKFSLLGYFSFRYRHTNLQTYKKRIINVYRLFLVSSARWNAYRQERFNFWSRNVFINSYTRVDKKAIFSTVLFCRSMYTWLYTFYFLFFTFYMMKSLHDRFYCGKNLLLWSALGTFNCTYCLSLSNYYILSYICYVNM